MFQLDTDGLKITSTVVPGKVVEIQLNIDKTEELWILLKKKLPDILIYCRQQRLVKAESERAQLVTRLHQLDVTIENLKSGQIQISNSGLENQTDGTTAETAGGTG